MLLSHEAATWWQGIKPQVTDWHDAVHNIRCAFRDRRPPHKIYRDLFSQTQQENEKTDLFVSKARALLMKLPQGDLTEKVQLDMMYGLLNTTIKKRIRREEICSFLEPLERARQIEDSMDTQTRYVTGPAVCRTRPVPFSGHHAQSNSTSEHTKQRNTRTTRVTNANMSSVFPVEPKPSMIENRNENKQFKVSRKYCVYCKNYGHRREECRKLNKQDCNMNIVSSTASIMRYSCREKGVIRSEYSKCNSEFNSVEVNYFSCPSAVITMYK
ncbi:unnamed protein product [Parnassius mnemosyne]|uniref:Retrotransposon gag domain-containing protein n=1 Tax=Parnassius mnemosyne TaxID=213953 RepID=A0AAV1LAH5_9NEOP